MEVKSIVKWLGIWLDSKLNFKEYVEKKVAQAMRIFHQIKRLSCAAKRSRFLTNITGVTHVKSRTFDWLSLNIRFLLASF